MSEGAEAFVEHLTQCRPDLQAAVVVDGNADQLVADLLAAGWTWAAPTERVMGKRIRTLSPPKENA